MLILMYMAFLFVFAASLTGWGALAMPADREWPARFGAGSLVVFFLVAAAGWSRILVPGVLWVLLAAGLLLWARPGRFSRPPGILLISLFGLTVLPLVLLPPVSRDALIHHLYQARLWLETGGIVRPRWSGFFSYPYLTESFYALTGGTFGFRVSRAVSFIGFLAACSVPVSWFLRRGRKREAVISLLVLLSIPELFRNASWSYSDTFLIFFSLLAYMELVKEKGSPVMAVIWAAGAACCKYNGFLVLASVCVLIPFHFRGISRNRIITAVLGGLFISAWWAVPNLVQWGNPAYPLLRSIFGPADTLTARAADYFAIAPFSSSLDGFLDYLLLPVRISLHGQWNDPALFDGAGGPLLLAGTIIAIPVLRGKRRKFALPLLYMLLTVAFKGAGLRTRYLLPGMAMLAVPVSEALSGLLDSSRPVSRYAIVLLMAGCLVWSGGKVVRLYEEERPWELPPDGSYLSRRLPGYDFFSQCDRFVTPGDTTLMVNIIRVFYYPGHAVFSDVRAPLDLVRMFWEGMEAGEVADSLRRAGVSHLAADMLLTSINVPPVLEDNELVEWRDFMSRCMTPLLSVDRFILFRLGGPGEWRMD